MSEIFQDLNDDNFLLFAIKAYDNPNCLISEFEDDIKRIDYLKRLFFRYKEYDDLKERLIINHIIILSNVFGIKFSVKMLFFKLNEQHYSVLKTFLLFLNIMPEKIVGINGKCLNSSDISVDLKIASVLRNMK
jgi:hypothetical protein